MNLKLLCLASAGIALSSPAFATEPDTPNCAGNDAIRFATFNVFLNRPKAGQLGEDLNAGDAQARAVAEIIQRLRPDVLLLNEFDYDESGETLKTFQQRYLQVSQAGAEPIRYAHRFLAPSNTGIAAPIDVNSDGTVALPTDAFGYGQFPGQYAMALLSRFPIESAQIRTFQRFLWRDMPGALLPDDLATPEPQDFYSERELKQFRLSSKSHWDLPVRIGDTEVHVLAAHPTPAVFDGPEDHNGRRNHDEIRFWADYLNNKPYLYDDEGTSGGLSGSQRFVILGDYNADPVDGDSHRQAIRQLLNHPLVDAATVPKSFGGIAAARLDANIPPHRGNPAADTSDFSQNLRIDYVLPSKWGLRSLDAGVFWPAPEDPLYRLVGDGDPVVSSDHRLVWHDLRLTDCEPSSLP